MEEEGLIKSLKEHKVRFVIRFMNFRACPKHKRPVKDRRLPEILIFRLNKTRSLVMLSRGFCD